LILFFYSGNFLDFSILRGLYETFHYWAATGSQGHGHEKPWYYWLKLLVHYEWPMLAGLAACFFVVLPKTNRLIRLLAVYGCGAFAAYSIVHYKTPWCIISLFWPFAFLLGDGVVRLAGSHKAARIATITAAAALLSVSAWRTAWLNFYHYTDEDEPYVYVQTFEEINKLTAPLFALVKADPANYHLKGHILLSSSYPLPWVLGDFTRVGYYSDSNTPDDFDEDFLLVDKSRVDEVERALRGRYFTDPLRLRGSQDGGKLYLAYQTFRALFPGREPEFEGAFPE
jgi:hypothetical protein